MTNKTWNKLLKKSIKKYPNSSLKKIILKTKKLYILHKKNKNNYTQKAGAKSKNTQLNNNKIKFKLEYKI